MSPSHTFMDILRIVYSSEVKPNSSTKIDEFHVMKIQEKGHRRRKTQG